MTDEEWQHSFARCLGLYLAGDALEEHDEKGNAVVDNKFLLLVNAHDEPISFILPDLLPVSSWHLLLDTSRSKGEPGEKRIWEAKGSYPLLEHSLVLLVESPGWGEELHVKPE